MQGREKIGSSRGIRLVGIALVAALLMGLIAAPAMAKKKKRPPAATATAAIPLASSSQNSSTARCPRGTHVTGGGWSISNPYSANSTNALGDDTGTRLTHLQSQPSSLFSWTAGAAALANPAGATTLTTYARCENRTLGAILFGASATAPVPIGDQKIVRAECPRGSHVLSGGFSFAPPGDLADSLGFRATVKESRRTAPDTWQIDIVNPVGAPSDVTLSVNILCELNRKGGGVSEASQVVPIADNNRTSATATCTGKTHSVAGGFLVSPSVGPSVGVDQMQPVGAKAWQVALYESPGFGLPAGSTLTAYSYCKKNALPKPKGR
jgi:hypothetical protein